MVRKSPDMNVDNVENKGKQELLTSISGVYFNFGFQFLFKF